MSSDARTLPLRDGPLGDASTRGWRLRARAGALAGSSTEVRVGAIALVAIVLCSALVVVVAANRPSILAPTAHAHFFPHWMAGPLGGIWPGLTRSSAALKYLFTGAMAVMYASYLAGLACARRLPARWVITAILAVHAIFLLAPPLALTDVFNYINYGRMEVVHHLNPYTTIPILEPHGDPSFALSNWHELLSPYGPLFTLATFAVVPLGVVASFWAIKLIIAAASLATIFLVWKCARRLGRDPVAAIVLVGLNPIVLIWGLGGDHNDFMTVLFIVLGFYLLLAPAPAAEAGSPDRYAARLVRPRSRAGTLAIADIGAGAAFVTAAAIKASAGVLIPIVLAGLLRTPRRLAAVLLGMVAAGAVVGVASLIAFGLHLPDLSTQGRLVTNVSLPNLLGLAVGSGGETDALRRVLSGVLGASLLLCCVFAWRGSGRRPGFADRTLTASGWANVALLVTLSWVLPWYVLWVLPLAALSSSRRLRATALVLGVYLVVAWAPASGLLWNAIGFHPERTPLGRLHQRDVKELLD